MALRWISVLLVFCVASVLAAADPLNYVLNRTITFDRPYTPYFATNFGVVTRVNLDLSLDGGSNWSHRIAHGLDAAWGENNYEWSVRVTPELWTENARIAVRTLWSSTTNEIMFFEGSMSTGSFAICGVRILSPTNNEVVLQPGYKTLRWHEAGSDYVDIGVSTNAGATWTHLYTLASSARTNSYSLPIVGLPTGRVDFCVAAFSNLYDTVSVRIVNQ